jgi:hypothetical protein
VTRPASSAAKRVLQDGLTDEFLESLLKNGSSNCGQSLDFNCPAEQLDVVLLARKEPVISPTRTLDWFFATSSIDSPTPISPSCRTAKSNPVRSLARNLLDDVRTADSFHREAFLDYQVGFGALFNFVFRRG